MTDSQRPAAFRFCPRCGERLSILDRGGAPRPTCENCGYIQYLNPVVGVAMVVRDEQILFSESNSRFLVEVPKLDAAKFERLLYGVTRSQIGRVTSTGRLVALGLGGKPVIDESIDDLRESWLRPLDW